MELINDFKILRQYKYNIVRTRYFKLIMSILYVISLLELINKYPMIIIFSIVLVILYILVNNILYEMFILLMQSILFISILSINNQNLFIGLMIIIVGILIRVYKPNRKLIRFWDYKSKKEIDSLIGSVGFLIIIMMSRGSDYDSTIYYTFAGYYLTGMNRKVLISNFNEFLKYNNITKAKMDKVLKNYEKKNGRININKKEK